MEDARGAALGEVRGDPDLPVPNGVLQDGQQRYTATTKLEDEEDQGGIDVVEDLDMALVRELEGDNGQDRFDLEEDRDDAREPIASTSKSAALDPSLASAGTKKKTATSAGSGSTKSKKRRKRNMDDVDDSRGRRKKVSKACIYCKRYV
jgi:hypothetical protein